MNYNLLWKMEVKEHIKTKKELSSQLSTKNELILALMSNVKALEEELETIINKHNAERLTGNGDITINCDNVNILYG